MIKVFLIRHALTDTAGKRLSGRFPGVSLNDEGRKQSLRLAERLKVFRIDAIYISPLERALQTAAPLAKSLHLSPIISEDFMEVDFGNWTNCSIEEIKNDPQFIRFNTFRSNTRIPGGELMQEAQLRIIKGLEKLRTQYPNKSVIVVSHADMIKSAIAWYAGIHLDMFQRIEISPASVSILELSEDTAKILLLNATGEIGI